MPLKGIRARATRHGAAISDLRARIRALEARIGHIDAMINDRWNRTVTKVNDLRDYISIKLDNK